MNSGGWIFSILAILLLLALVVAVIVWITREVSGHRDGGPTIEMSAREILDRRLASGEITTEQHEQLRQTLAQP
ncbi:MAG TPA: SHOCT domain-containing protein [Solirubrobacterales bacterium]|nr:SHOCT domain-containing protein [Solirubrobacterales bacterium]